jgi:hypothetical protein
MAVACNGIFPGLHELFSKRHHYHIGVHFKIKDRKIINADSLMDNPLARKQLLEVDGIVLEVKYGQTKFEDIKEELKLIMLTDKPVIGYIAD